MVLIIATVGPSIKDKKVLKEIIEVGANGLRLNFSHGDLNNFEDVIKTSKEIKKDIRIIQDLTGSKIRVSNILPYIIKIYNGEEILFCGEDIYEANKGKYYLNRKKIIPLNFDNEILSANKIKSISMKDNTMHFKIIKTNNDGIFTKVIKGGIVRGGKGCNIKGFSRNELGLLPKDKKDIKWGLEKKVDIICQSFVECDEDILQVKDYINNELKSTFMPKIWAKVETIKGIDKLDEISKVVDGVVIGRGDLIPESSIVLTPILEDKAFKKLKDKKNDLIVATHILNSMKGGKSAEISEVESIYNHMKAGVNGFMLAGETSIGKAPIRTVEFIKKITDKYEKVIREYE